MTSPLVLFETVFTLERSYDVPKARVVELLLPILELRGLTVPDKPLWRLAFQLHLAHPIDFVDAYNAAFMHWRGVSEIYTWDEDFDQVPRLTRVEPADEEEAAA